MQSVAAVRQSRPALRVERSAHRVEELFTDDLAVLDGEQADLVHGEALAAALVRDIVGEANGESVVVRVRTRVLRLVHGVVVGPPLALRADGIEPLRRTVLPCGAPASTLTVSFVKSVSRISSWFPSLQRATYFLPISLVVVMAVLRSNEVKAMDPELATARA